MMAIPADIVPRVGQLIRLLASDQDGEVVASARALGRALKNAGCDFHTLADSIGCQPAPPPRPAHRPAEQPAQKPKPAPPAWPTFSTLKHSQRCAWLDAIQARSYCFEKKNRARFEDLRTKMIVRPHEILSRKETNLFNTLVKVMWMMEVRV